MFMLKVMHCLQILERETSREKNLEKAMKEAKIRARKEASKGTDDSKKDANEQEIKQVSCSVPRKPSDQHKSIAGHKRMPTLHSKPPFILPWITMTWIMSLYGAGILAAICLQQ